MVELYGTFQWSADNNNNNKVTYKLCSLKNSDALQAYAVQYCGTGLPA